MQWFLHETTTNASNSARFLYYIFQSSLKSDFPSGETMQKRLPSTTPAASPKQLKYYAKKNMMGDIFMNLFIISSKGSYESRKNRSTLVLFTSKCTARGEHDRYCFWFYIAALTFSARNARSFC